MIQLVYEVIYLPLLNSQQVHNFLALRQHCNMKLPPFFFSLGMSNSLANAYFTMAIYAPDHVSIDGKIVNARDKSFIIGADTPSTYPTAV